MDSILMLYEAIRIGLTEETRQDWGELTGEKVLQLAADRGIETRYALHDPYQAVINTACLADILATALRKPDVEPWIVPDPTLTPHWVSSAFLDPTASHLRRLVIVSHWSEERKLSEVRSWYSLGEVCQFALPMQMVVAVIGQVRDGRRHSPWCKGLLNPNFHAKIRFQKRQGRNTQGFKDTWEVAWREDHGEIDREKWLQAMLEDDVLREHLFIVDIPVPRETGVKVVREMAARKLTVLRSLRGVPEKQLTGCEGPISPCPFRWCCWDDPERAPDRRGYDNLL